MKKMKARMEAVKARGGMGGGKGGNGMIDWNEPKDRMVMTGADGSMMIM